jgi:hypothetical protein
MTQSTDSTTPSLNHPLITATLPTGAGIYRLTSKFLSFAPAFSFARNHLGCAPRPAQVLPCLSRYLTGAFRPLSGCAPGLERPLSFESSSRSCAALLLKVFSISSRSFNNASTDIEERLGLGICYLQRERAHLYLLYWSKQIMRSLSVFFGCCNPKPQKSKATSHNEADPTQ